MKAIRIHSYGGPEVMVHEDIPEPRVGKNDVLICVHAAGVNPVDWKIRSGCVKDVMRYKPPFVPGWDVSGIVEAVGPCVSTFQTGDAVFSHPNFMRGGAYAEYIAVEASEVALKPKSLNHAQAAAVPLAALTAWQSLFDAAGLVGGQRVMIHAAAGGVGIFAVQLAKWQGAHVIGTGSSRNSDFLRGLGVDEVIDYKINRFEHLVHDIDVVLDAVGGETQERSWKLLRKSGILVSIVTSPPAEVAAKHSVRSARVVVQPNADQLTRIAALIDGSWIKPIIEAVLPLTEAPRSHELSQSGHTRGKIVLSVVD